MHQHTAHRARATSNGCIRHPLDKYASSERWLGRHTTSAWAWTILSHHGWLVAVHTWSTQILHTRMGTPAIFVDGSVTTSYPSGNSAKPSSTWSQEQSSINPSWKTDSPQGSGWVKTPPAENPSLASPEESSKQEPSSDKQHHRSTSSAARDRQI